MQVRIEDVSPVEKKLCVEVPWQTVSDKLAAAYKELSREVALKGFRKGKVPRSVLERMFGKRVKAEVARELVREGFFTATAEHNLEAVAEPHVADDALVIKKGEPFAFEALVEVKGTVEAKDYGGMELNRRPLKVADEAVDSHIEQLREQHTELLPIEGRDLTASTDVLSLKVKGTVGEHEVDREQMAVDLGDRERGPLPGLVDALIGLPLDVQDHTIGLDIPEDYEDESVAGRRAELTISILEGRRKETPELDDEFAKDLDRGDTVDDLRASVRKELEEQQAEEIKRELRDAALKELVNRNQIPVAPALVERAIEFKYRQMTMMLGIPAEHAASGLDEEMRGKLRPSALDEVRGQLLLDAVADAEGLEVTEDEIGEYFTDLGKHRGQPAARLRAEYDRDGRLDNVKFQLRQDKTLDLLIERATVTEKEPEPEPEPGAGEDASEPASTEE
jgi:trigger factor